MSDKILATHWKMREQIEQWEIIAHPQGTDSYNGSEKTEPTRFS